jgi:hypothetical protein
MTLNKLNECTQLTKYHHRHTSLFHAIGFVQKASFPLLHISLSTNLLAALLCVPRLRIIKGKLGTGRRSIRWLGHQGFIT